MENQEVFDISALVIPVPEAEEIAGPYRRRYTKDGARGMPAHITILYPFLTAKCWNDNSRQLLAETISSIPSFSFQLSKVCRFAQHRVLYLEPSPGEAILQVIRAIAQAFPDFPPYEGAFPLDQLRAHMTLAVGSTNDELARIEEEFKQEAASYLPLRVIARESWLMVKAADKWRPLSRFSFGTKKA